MLSPRTLFNANYGQVTPVAYTNLKPSARKLWQKENLKLEPQNDKWNKYRNLNNHEKWDGIESPQFVDFSNVPENGDSFFNRLTVIVSTPNPNLANEKLPNKVSDDDTLVASLNNFSLSAIEYEPEEIQENSNHQQEKEEEEEYVVHNSTVKLKCNVKTEACNKAKKPQGTVVYPFTFDLREKHKQNYKQERIKKMLEEDKKVREFRANPVPKFVKTRAVSAYNHNHHSNNNNNQNNNNNKNNSNEKAQKVNYSDKQIKKSSELWKKPAFVPCLSKKKVEVPKMIPLQTAIRAEERKRFEQILKEKERQREQTRQMEIAAKKKQEEEEIAQLRKQIVHKAQPVRIYKTKLPQVVKRPLTDPITPLILKRRRFV